MKKFEEEVRKNGGGCFEVFKNGKTTYEIQGLTSSPLIIFRDWVSPEDHQTEILSLKAQLEKQQPEIPEVPQFVADWYEENKHRIELATFSINANICVKSSKARCDIEDWFADAENKPIETIFAMKNGYTVKEKRFYLKHKSVLIFDPDSDDSDVEELYLGAGGNFVPYQHLAKIFTQSEIDSMETGSYEQIEVQE